MHFRREMNILLLIILCSVVLEAQELYPLRWPMSLVSYRDSGSIGGTSMENPADLVGRQNLVPLKIRVSQQSETGEFRRSFEPGKSARYQYSVEGAREVSTIGVVHGSFGFVQEFERDRMWNDTRLRHAGDPLLIADSSTGTTVFKGIVLGGTYAAQPFENLMLGAHVRFGVENGVKLVSPKPLTMTRSIGGSVGATVLLSQEWNAGISVDAENEKEEDDFTADQTTKQSQSIIYKFIGYDAFLRQIKNTENRIQQLESFAGHLHLAYQGEDAATSIAVGMRDRSADVVDGGSSPVPQGYWQSDEYEGRATAMASFLGWRWVANADVSFKDQWTQHPNFAVLLTRQQVKQALIALGVSMPMFGQELSVGYAAAFTGRDLHDHISLLTADCSSLRHELTLGARCAFNEKELIRVWGSVEAARPGKQSINVTAPSSLYRFVGGKDLGYEIAKSFGFNAGIDVVVDGGAFGLCTVNLIYGTQQADASGLLDGTRRSLFELSISTEL